MGNSQGGAPENKAERKQNAAIDRMMKKDKDKETRKMKLLILGTGESGKSTFVKQLRNLYGRKYTEQEINDWIPRIYENVNNQILSLMAGAKSLGMTLNSEVVAPFEDPSFSPSTVINSELAEAVKAFWNDPQTQAVWDKRANYQILECIEYYVEHIDRIGKDDYVPTFPDVVQARVRTTGIVTEKFEIDNINFELYDVGGQRNERKKWINCFDNVTTVIFVAAINEYDQKLFEDSQTDRIEEALNVFEQTVNNPMFKDISFIIFFNKFDLFQEKLFQVPYRIGEGENRRNVDFEGPYAEDLKDPDDLKFKEDCIEAAALHTQQLFDNRADTRSGLGALRYHHTTATDEGNVDVVFKECKNQILRRNLNQGGFGKLT